MCDVQLSASVVSAILPGWQIFSPISLSIPLGRSSSERVWTVAGHQMKAGKIGIKEEHDLIFEAIQCITIKRNPQNTNISFIKLYNKSEQICLTVEASTSKILTKGHVH